MGARRTARERALQALFQLDGEPATTGSSGALDSAWSASDDEGPAEPEAATFASEIVEGVRAKLAEIDPLLEQHSHHWRLDRMSRIDRNVLRLGVWELKFRDDIPRKVTLNEAVELGKKFGNEESSGFINGLLDKIAGTLNKP